jgi:hypothetical protein
VLVLKWLKQSIQEKWGSRRTKVERDKPVYHSPKTPFLEAMAAECIGMVSMVMLWELRPRWSGALRACTMLDSYIGACVPKKIIIRTTAELRVRNHNA